MGKIIGIIFGKKNTPWQRIDEAGNSIDVAPGYFDEHPAYAGIQDEIIDGQHMVRVPTFYYRSGVIESGEHIGKKAVWISDEHDEGFSAHPAFMRNAMQLKAFYVGKYQGTPDGDMLGSQGMSRKQKPWDEAIRVPLLVRLPGAQAKGRKIDVPINTPDLMPTLLGLCGAPVPASAQGDDWSALVRGAAAPADNPVLIECPAPFGEWTRARGGREYRGVRTRRHTYVRDLNGPWLLFDNEADPYQLDNLVGKPEQAPLQARLEGELQKLLKKTGDDFQPGPAYIAKWGYAVDASGTVPIR
jgi:arylsulfatase A-like enzyme